MLGETGDLMATKNGDKLDRSEYCVERKGAVIVNNVTGQVETDTAEFPLVAVVCAKSDRERDVVKFVVIPILLIVS